MLSSRLQILIDPARRRRLDAEARRRGLSVGEVVREAIDAQLGGPSEAEKREAIEEMRRHRPRGPELEPDALAAMIDEATTEAALREGPDPRSG